MIKYESNLSRIFRLFIQFFKIRFFFCFLCPFPRKKKTLFFTHSWYWNCHEGRLLMAGNNGRLAFKKSRPQRPAPGDACSKSEIAEVLSNNILWRDTNRFKRKVWDLSLWEGTSCWYGFGCCCLAWVLLSQGLLNSKKLQPARMGLESLMHP